MQHQLMATTGSRVSHASILQVVGLLKSSAIRMLNKSASIVLAPLRDSTYRMRLSEVGSTRGCLSVRQDPLQGRTAHTKCGMYLLASSLAAALLGTRRVLARQGWEGEKSGLFEHPAGGVLLLCHTCDPRSSRVPTQFSRNLLAPSIRPQQVFFVTRLGGHPFYSNPSMLRSCGRLAWLGVPRAV